MATWTSCGYCGLFIGTTAHFPGGKNVVLSQHIDHFFPQSKAGTESDRVLSCNICNLRKGTKVFKDEFEARTFLQQAWMQSGATFSSGLRDIGDIPSKPFKGSKRRTYEEAIRTNSMPELQARTIDESPESKVLLNHVPSPSVSRAEETPRAKEAPRVRPEQPRLELLRVCPICNGGVGFWNRTMQGVKVRCLK